MMLTTVVDVFWLLFWVPYYNGKELAKLNYGLHMTVAIVTCLEIALKVIIFLFLFRTNANNKPKAGGQIDKQYYNQQAREMRENYRPGGAKLGGPGGPQQF